MGKEKKVEVRRLQLPSISCFFLSLFSFSLSLSLPLPLSLSPLSVVGEENALCPACAMVRPPPLPPALILVLGCDFSRRCFSVSEQRFRFCGGQDCPDWLLAEISLLTRVVSEGWRDGGREWGEMRERGEKKHIQRTDIQTHTHTLTHTRTLTHTHTHTLLLDRAP